MSGRQPEDDRVSVFVDRMKMLLKRAPGTPCSSFHGSRSIRGARQVALARERQSATMRRARLRRAVVCAREVELSGRLYFRHAGRLMQGPAGVTNRTPT